MHFHDIFLKYTFILITWYGNIGGTRPPPMRLGRPTYVLMNQSQIGSRSGGSSASKIVIAYSISHWYFSIYVLGSVSGQCEKCFVNFHFLFLLRMRKFGTDSRDRFAQVREHRRSDRAPFRHFPFFKRPFPFFKLPERVVAGNYVAGKGRCRKCLAGKVLPEKGLPETGGPLQIISFIKILNNSITSLCFWSTFCKLGYADIDQLNRTITDLHLIV